MSMRDIYLRRYGVLPPGFAESVPDYRAPEMVENTKMWDIGQSLDRSAYKIGEMLGKKKQENSEETEEAATPEEPEQKKGLKALISGLKALISKVN